RRLNQTQQAAEADALARDVPQKEIPRPLAIGLVPHGDHRPAWLSAATLGSALGTRAGGVDRHEAAALALVDASFRAAVVVENRQPRATHLVTLQPGCTDQPFLAHAPVAVHQPLTLRSEERRVGEARAERRDAER